MSSRDWRAPRTSRPGHGAALLRRARAQQAQQAAQIAPEDQAKVEQVCESVERIKQAVCDGEDPGRVRQLGNVLFGFASELSRNPNRIWECAGGLVSNKQLLVDLKNLFRHAQDKAFEIYQGMVVKKWGVGDFHHQPEKSFNEMSKAAGRLRAHKGNDAKLLAQLLAFFATLEYWYSTMMEAPRFTGGEDNVSALLRTMGERAQAVAHQLPESSHGGVVGFVRGDITGDQLADFAESGSSLNAVASDDIEAFLDACHIPPGSDEHVQKALLHFGLERDAGPKLRTALGARNKDGPTPHHIPLVADLVRAGDEPASAVDDEQLVADVMQAPYHVDLARYLSWDTIHKPHFGSLLTFLSRRFERPAAFRFLQISNGVVWKTQPCTLEEVQPGAKDLPLCLACALLSMTMDGKEVQAMKKKLAGRWEELDLKPQQILETLGHLPELLWKRVGGRVLLSVAKDKSQACTTSLVEAAVTHRQRLALRVNDVHVPNPERALVSELDSLHVSTNGSETSASTTTTMGTPSPAPQLAAAENDTSSPSGPLSPDQCNNVIQAIRTQYKTAANGDLESNFLVDCMERTMVRLSDDLYAANNHFMMELVQNADDNHYSLVDRPTMFISVSDSQVVVETNEDGFTEEDVRAICKVNDSTKSGHRDQFIGNKGIGFKSVFKVSNTPEIHSNNFHFKFDASTPLGYVLPHPVSTPRDWDKHVSDGRRTLIRLPLKQGCEKPEDLVGSIDPLFLLFLRKLHVIQVQDDDGNMIKRIERVTKDSRLLTSDNATGTSQYVTLRTAESEQRFFVVQMQFDLENEELKGSAAPTLSVAVPLNASEGIVAQQQQLFSFLPVAHFGFRMILQGSWELTANREEISKDSPWNRELRHHIPALFDALCRAVVARHAPQTDASDEASWRLFQAVASRLPTTATTVDFFQGTDHLVLHRLQRVAFLPTETAGEVVEPPGAVYLKRDGGASEVDLQALQAFLELGQFHLLHERLDITQATAAKLGVHVLEDAPLLAIMRKCFAAAAAARKSVPVPLVAWLLARVGRFVELTQSNVQELKSVRFIPLSDGGVTSISLLVGAGQRPSQDFGQELLSSDSRSLIVHVLGRCGFPFSQAFPQKEPGEASSSDETDTSSLPEDVELQVQTPSLAPGNSDSRSAFGRDGEQAVYNLLRDGTTMLPAFLQGGSDWQWINEEGEQGTQHDIVGTANGTPVYVEVKTTREQCDCVFLSKQELLFAEQQQDSFVLVHFSPPNRVRFIQNPANNASGLLVHLPHGPFPFQAV